MKSLLRLTAGNTLIPVVLYLSWGTACWSAETPENNPPAQEDLGCDVVDGVTNKILHVSSVNPLSIYVLYEGGNRGRWILRQDLPPQLKAKYAYDPAKAAEYQKRQIERQKQQAELAAQLATAQRAAQREALNQREKEILAEIAKLEKQDVEDQKEKNGLKSLPPGNGRRVQAAHIDNDQQNIRERIQQLKTLLQQVRAQKDSVP
jgi:ATPase subunit of ABC transporter with duplicated ATPase domains